MEVRLGPLSILVGNGSSLALSFCLFSPLYLEGETMAKPTQVVADHQFCGFSSVCLVEEEVEAGVAIVIAAVVLEVSAAVIQAAAVQAGIGSLMDIVKLY